MISESLVERVHISTPETVIEGHFYVFSTGIDKFMLHDCTPKEEANTSICLEWKRGNFLCDSEKISYQFHCKTGTILSREVLLSEETPDMA